METSTKWPRAWLFLSQPADRPTWRASNYGQQFSQTSELPQETPCSWIVDVLVSALVDVQGDDLNPIDGILSPFLRLFPRKKMKYNTL